MASTLAKAFGASALALTLLLLSSTTQAAPTTLPSDAPSASEPSSAADDHDPYPAWLDKLYPANLPVGGPRRFDLTAPAPGNKWSQDLPSTCRALSTEVPALLSNTSSLDGERYNLTNVITLFYEEGKNPTLAQLAADIPPGAIVPGKDDLAQSVNNDIDWTPKSVKADRGYGYQDEVQTQLGGLPSFCRFGASVVTSATSQVWFEVWMPLPNTGAVIFNRTECAVPTGAANVTGQPPQPVLNDTSSCANPSAPLPAQPPAPTPPILVGSAAMAPGLSGIVPPDQPAGKQTAFAMGRSTATPNETPTWRPASRRNWKGRLIFSGNAGLRGNIPYAELKQTLTRYREAAAGSNSGHFSSGAGSLWAKGPGNTESLLDFGSRAPHVATVAAAEVVKKFYGVVDREPEEEEEGDDKEAPKRLGFGMYWKGCSTGGRQGFGEAQKYPRDYDGILAGAPAFDYSSLNAYQIYVNSLQADRKAPAYIPSNLYPLIHKAVLDACDGSDGSKDGIVGEALSCKPDFTALLLCKSVQADAAAATCLTAPQIQNLERIYKPYYLNGTYIHGPVLPSSEFGWTVTNGVTGAPFSAAPAYYQYWLQQRTDNPQDFDFYKEVTPELIEKGRATDPGSTDNFSPELSAYFSRGSRIIHYHGLADQLIPASKSIQYWRSAVARLGRAEVNKHYRLFLVPSMQHCRLGDGAYNFGGASQFDQPGWRPLKFDTEHDMLLALFDWSELGAGHAPYYQIGASYLRDEATEALNPPTTPQDVRSYVNGVRVTRRLCPYPKSPVLLDQSRNGTTLRGQLNVTALEAPANSTRAEDYKCIDDGSFDVQNNLLDLRDHWSP